MNDKEQKPILVQLQEVAEEICDKYCKHPGQYVGKDQEKLHDEVCNGCPLERLL